MTRSGDGDRTYIEPAPPTWFGVIELEAPRCLLPTMGGRPPEPGGWTWPKTAPLDASVVRADRRTCSDPGRRRPGACSRGDGAHRVGVSSGHRLSLEEAERVGRKRSPPTPASSAAFTLVRLPVAASPTTRRIQASCKSRLREAARFSQILIERSLIGWEELSWR